MSWKQIAQHTRSDYGKRYRTDALEIENAGCLIQTTVERVEPGGTSVGISTVFVPGVKVVEVEPGKFKLSSRWPLDDEFAQAAIGGGGVDDEWKPQLPAVEQGFAKEIPPVTSVELTNDTLPPTEDVTAVPVETAVEIDVPYTPETVAPVDPAPTKKKAKG